MLVNFIFYRLEKKQTKFLESSVAIINRSTRQQMLLHRIGLLAAILVRSSSHDEQTQLRKDLLEEVRTFESLHQELTAEGSIKGHSAKLSPEILAIYFNPPLLLDEQIREFASAAKGLADEKAASQKSAHFRHLSKAISTGALLQAMEEAVRQYQKENVAGIIRLQNLREWMLGGNVLLVLVMVVTVFFPLIRQVRSNISKLQLLNLTLEQRMASQKQAQETLAHQARELAISNAELEQFASVASHDLQEPLRKIIAFGDRLQSKCNDALGAEGLDYLQRMQNAARRMQTLINALLTLSRVTSRAKPFVQVDLAGVVKEVLADLEVRIEQVAGRVDVGPLPQIDADPMQVRQLMQNLIGNALKFHHPSRPAIVKVHSCLVEDGQGGDPGNDDTRACQIVVEDNGVGFDRKYADRLFKVFERLHSRNEYEGTGVGLAICRKIAERHGGAITAESELMRGSRFIVTLPLRQVAERHADEGNHDPVRG